VVLAPLLLALGCAPSAPPKELRLRVAYPTNPSAVLIWVAQEARFFEAEHLRVEASIFSTGREALATALSGEVDAAAVYSTPVVLATMSGEDVVVVTTLHRANGLTGVAVHPGTNIRTAHDLPGHRIGVTPRTSSQLALEVLLAEAGLNGSKVRLVPGQPDELIAALQAGELDAASLWVPNLLLVTGQGKALLLVSETYTEMSMLAGIRSRIEARRTEVTRFLRALQRAQDLIRERPELVASTLRSHFPALGTEGLEIMVSHSRFELGLSNLLLASLRQEAAWLEQQGEKRETRIGFREVMAPALLEEVSPESVTLLGSATGSLQ
jgi:NitT/TauT family transport system substrate-binding protein